MGCLCGKGNNPVVEVSAHHGSTATYSGGGGGDGSSYRYITSTPSSNQFQISRTPPKPQSQTHASTVTPSNLKSTARHILDKPCQDISKFDRYGQIIGGYLFSSSFDKTVRVWSLQDFSHLHTFRGHENKVMALVYVDDEEQLCISGDSGGGILVWGIDAPLSQDPLRKWYEKKDWRFSGIHSLTAFGNLLYTGSGDRTIKAWSLKDGTLMCTMDGHKSVVSTLSVCDEVLYSGSWDGTVRLWSLNDHSPLVVLGEDLPGETKSILAITASRDLLVAAYENGCIKVWRNDVFLSSKTLHNGAIFAMSLQGKWLYTGGWDKNVNIQELSGDELELTVNAFGSIPSSSVVTAMLCSQGKLYIGYGDKSIKVYRAK